jgi:hypothetical protein
MCIILRPSVRKLFLILKKVEPKSFDVALTPPTTTKEDSGESSVHKTTIIVRAGKLEYMYMYLLRVKLVVLLPGRA